MAKWIMRVLLVAILSCLGVCGLAQTVKLVGAGADVGWRTEHDVSKIESTAAGLSIWISGGDPYIACRPFFAPKAKQLWIDIEVQSEQGGMAQVFYCAEGEGAAEARSVRFPVPVRKAQKARLAIPRLADRMYLRFDPPGTDGLFRILSLKVMPAVNLEPPKTINPVFPKKVRGPRLVSDGVALVQSSSSSDFQLTCDGVLMAHGNPSSAIAWSDGKNLTWTSVGKSNVRFSAKEVCVSYQAGPIAVERRFSPCKGGFSFRVTVSARKEAEVFFAPAMMLFAGQGSFGNRKQQALFCGLEYLEGDEPSSSEKDILGAEAIRRLPLATRVTVPLMAVNAESRFVALAWRRNPNVSAFFDSPDRTFGSAGHAMGLLLPGSTGTERTENNLVAYRGLKLAKGQRVEASGWILAGKGKTAVEAVKAYLAVAPKPSPLKPLTLKDYALLAAKGWLDSGVNEDGRYRHAYWPGINSFGPSPSPDAAFYMKWLAQYSGPEAARRLNAQAEKALSLVAPERYGMATISHLPTFSNALVLGGLKEAVQQSEAAARDALSKIRGDGTQKYVANGTDYGKTHFADHANGPTGRTLLTAIECALFCGDPELINQAVESLRRARTYRGTVPRGAQTWEVPLHTPDIMASAHLCKAYSLAYEATGDRSFLDDAEYWAYTGLPFVYADNPTSGRVGKYATIAVFGATNWVAPNWMGLPVQWCGAVYADALYAFSRHSKNPMWKTLADGIFDSGVAQTFNDSRRDLAGLLPDSFNLVSQTGNAVAINPGTMQALASQRYGLPPFYSWLDGVSAPGRLILVSKTASSKTVKIEPAFQGTYWVVVSGPRPVALVKSDGKEVDCQRVGSHAVAVRLNGPSELRVDYRVGLR